jgi:hypothetical protein
VLWREETPEEEEKILKLIGLWDITIMSINVVPLQISPQMWSLLPQVVACYDEFAIDYMEQMEVPLQNYICRGTEVLLTSQEPNYLGLVSS